MIAIAGYSLALLMGLTLGLIGAGGSILTVPILVYFLDVKPIMATAYSLLVVGTTALLGSLRYQRLGQVHIKEALTFAAPAMISVWLTRALLIPTMPVMILGISKDHLIMLIFSLLMITASYILLNDQPQSIASAEKSNLPLIKIILGAIFVGLLTGLVGAGGGFLIIPSLIALFGFSMKEAIGTSLAIITINSLLGFSGDLHHGITLDWQLLGLFLLMTLSGVIIGSKLSQQINGQKLKAGFAYFTLTIGILIFSDQLLEILR